MHLSRVQSIHRTKPNRNQARTRVVASNISDVYLCGRTGGRDVRRLHEHTNCACHLRGRTAFGSGMASRCRDKGRRMQTTRESRRRRRPLRARWKLVAVADVWRRWCCQKPTLDHALELASVRASMLERVLLEHVWRDGCRRVLPTERAHRQRREHEREHERRRAEGHHRAEEHQCQVLERHPSLGALLGSCLLHHGAAVCVGGWKEELGGGGRGRGSKCAIDLDHTQQQHALSRDRGNVAPCPGFTRSASARSCAAIQRMHRSVEAAALMAPWLAGVAAHVAKHEERRRRDGARCTPDLLHGMGASG